MNALINVMMFCVVVYSVIALAIVVPICVVILGIGAIVEWAWRGYNVLCGKRSSYDGYYNCTMVGFKTGGYLDKGEESDNVECGPQYLN